VTDKELIVKNGKKEGEWTVYTENGKVWKKYQYKKLLSLVDEAFISDYKMRLPMFIDWNTLKRNIQNRGFDLSLFR